MTKTQPAGARKRDEGSRSYLLFALVALLIILLGLIQRGNTLWTVLLLLVSAAAVAARWRSAPVLLLLGLVPALLSLHWTTWQLWAAAESDPLGDLLLSGAVLGFVAATYRMEGLVHHIVPPEARGLSSSIKRTKKKDALLESPPSRRSDRLVTTTEVAVLLVSLPLWAALGQAALQFLPGSWTDLGIDPRGWRAIVLVWLMGIGLLVTASFIRYLGQRRATLEEAIMPLQELLWKETRGEQRIINRWLAWARLRRKGGRHEVLDA